MRHTPASADLIGGHHYQDPLSPSIVRAVVVRASKDYDRQPAKLMPLAAALIGCFPALEKLQNKLLASSAC
jgi:hypothetical protein